MFAFEAIHAGGLFVSMSPKGVVMPLWTAEVAKMSTPDPTYRDLDALLSEYGWEIEPGLRWQVVGQAARIPVTPTPWARPTVDLPAHVLSMMGRSAAGK